MALSIEFHGFSDAPNLAIAAVMYIKVRTNENEVHVFLAYSKTRNSCLLQDSTLETTHHPTFRIISNTDARLSYFNYNTSFESYRELNFSVDWPSVDTLTWISSKFAKWKDQVQNRVTAVQETVPNASWRFVPGKKNTADCATRGLAVDQLKNHPLWWIGSPWLSKDSN